MEKSFEGYKSRGARSRFLVIAGILGVVFFLAQIIIPVLSGMVMLPIMLFSRQGEEIDNLYLPRSVIFKDSIWLTGYRYRLMDHSSVPDKTVNLYSYNPGPDSDLNLEMMLGMAEPFLLTIEENLWIIDEGSIYIHTGSDFSIITPENNLTSIMDVFVFRGLPGVIDDTEDEIVVKYFVNGRWRRYLKLQEKESNVQSGIRKQYKYGEVGDKAFIFMKHGNVLYYQELPNESELTEEPKLKDWTTLTRVSRSWSLQNLGGELYLFVTREKNNMNKAEFLKWTGESWETVYSDQFTYYNTASKYLVVNRDEYIILMNDVFGPNIYYHIVNGEKYETYQFGKSEMPFNFGLIFIYWFIIQIGIYIFPLILALILSSLMKKFRVSTHESEEGQDCADLAPLWKRGLAMAIDAILVFVPLLFIYYDSFLQYLPGQHVFTNPLVMHRKMLTMLPLAFLILISGLIFYSILEGIWGLTPGKWIFGIRVVNTEHKRLGIGRALIRNFLKVVDGFFNFMVGIMLIAVTRDWQRVGDMAAGSIVINQRKNRGDTDG